MHFSLFTYERRVLEYVRTKFELTEDAVIAIAGTMDDLRDIFSRLADAESSFHQGRVAVMGLANHTHHLFIGGLDALAQGNAHVWSACLRGVIETFGACMIISASPGTAPNFLSANVKAGKLRAAAEKARPGLGKDLDRLSAIVHPASGAIHAGFSVADREERIAVFNFGYKVPSAPDGAEGVAALANSAIITTEKLDELSLNVAVLNSGKVIMERAPEFDVRGNV